MNTEKNCSLHALAFALYETALYLDGHPNDRKAVEYYDKTRARYEKELEKYEQENGPVTMNSDAATKNGTWQWVNTPWPWQNEYHKS